MKGVLDDISVAEWTIEGPLEGPGLHTHENGVGRVLRARGRARDDSRGRRTRGRARHARLGPAAECSTRSTTAVPDRPLPERPCARRGLRGLPKQQLGLTAASPGPRLPPRRGPSSGRGRPAPVTTVRCLPGGGMPNGIALALNHQRRAPAPLELGQAALLGCGAPGRRARGTPGRAPPLRPWPPRCGRPPARPATGRRRSEWEPAQLARSQMLDHRGPGGVELARRARARGARPRGRAARRARR